LFMSLEEELLRKGRGEGANKIRREWVVYSWIEYL
jgi:hypothetical protein